MPPDHFRTQSAFKWALKHQFANKPHLFVTELLCDCFWHPSFSGTMSNADSQNELDFTDDEIRKRLAEADTGGTGGPPLPMQPKQPRQPN